APRTGCTAARAAAVLDRAPSGRVGARRGVSGAKRRARTLRGSQGHQAHGNPQQRGLARVCARVCGHLRDPPRLGRGDLRLRLSRRPRIHRDGIFPLRGFEDAAAAADHDRRKPRLRTAHLRWPQRHSRRRAHSPRPQATQRHAAPGWLDRTHRLRAGTRRRERRAYHCRRRVARLTLLYEPRAGPGPAPGCAQRSVQPGRDALRDAQRCQALLGQQRRGGHPTARARRTTALADRMPGSRAAARGADVAGALRALCRCRHGAACIARGRGESTGGCRAAGRRGGAVMTDVTAHLLPPAVQLELEALRDQRDLYRSLLLAEPAMLAAFMTHALETVERIRTSLRTSTRDQAAFRAKIERLLDELTALGEALLGLHLPTISTGLANALAALREVESRLAATGNDLLPAMVVLEELCSHLTVAADCTAVHVPLEMHEPAALELESSQRRSQLKLATVLE